MVTLASAGPRAMSGSDTGLATSLALCAMRLADQAQRRERAEGCKAGQGQGGVVKARRVIVSTVCSGLGAVGAQHTKAVR